MSANASRITRRAMLVASLATGLSLGLGPAMARAADWPKGPVQLVVPAKPGGGTDSAARIVAAALKEVIRRPVIVVNQPAGGGAVAAETVRNAKPDGQTLLFYHTGLLSTYRTGGYDHSPVTDFSAPVIMPMHGSYALVTGPDSGITDVKALVARAIAEPDSVTLGVQIRGATHFMAGLLEGDSDARFRIVDAGSDSDKLVAVQGGQIDAAFVNTPSALQYQQAGKARILGTISGDPGRDPGAPELPSVDEQGYRDMVFGFIFFALGPKALPAQTQAQINTAFTQVLTDPGVLAQFTQMKMPLSVLGPEAGQARLAQDDARIARTARVLGFE
ncbi:tripartite tricarboxylate transporter substrate binding protein [Pseudooceanicola sp. CBS1P-1]|uniref:Tripartite tricarboxylate transporter substrate binding protein n=1 Tax=Pseudooceanicola albus TaxID=2692189 RepID=A0A6L7G8C1_9RHOB|nr:MULTISPECIES: tripartite tricarboxylate transporter substrate binding protein [Pseudooceanicola]MBT9386255.1 tripartite tricarboxylate transporter substrate binding protein [Pseudooceanicola endophyticus]MXN20305.1 hypothetical protein [Pseudooceanicola albus]